MTTSRAVLADEAQHVYEILECLQKLTTYVFYDIKSYKVRTTVCI